MIASRTRALAAMALAGLVLLLSISSGLALRSRREGMERIRVQEERIAQLEEQVRELGGDPDIRVSVQGVPGPSGIPGSTGAPGPTGRPGTPIQPTPPITPIPTSSPAPSPSSTPVPPTPCPLSVCVPVP